MKTRIKLIGLTGNAGAGKSTVGNILRAHGFTTRAFADYGQADPALRIPAAATWIRCFVRDELQRSVSRSPRMAFVDVQSRNAAQLIRTWGGEIWRVHRLHTLASTTRIEALDLAVDRDLINDGSLQDLANEVSRLLQAAGLEPSR